MNDSSILLIKNLSGGFNEEGIGHEIINYYDRNDNDTNFYYFYVPPYGSVGSEKDSFYEEQKYRRVKTILVFDSTNITNILKLKAVVVDPIPFRSFNEMKNAAKNAKYGPNNKPLAGSGCIDFKDKEYLQQLDVQSDENEDDVLYVFPITYKVRKTKYYNLEDKNLFIWHKRTAKTDNLKTESLRKFRIVFGANANLAELDGTKLGQKNYIYNLGDDLYDWFENIVKPFLVPANVLVLSPITQRINTTYTYDKNNVLAFLKKLNDENIYTNFIKAILDANNSLKDLFFANLVEKLFGRANYTPTNVHVLVQHQSLIEEKKIANSYLKNRGKTHYAKAFERAKKKLTDEYGYSQEVLNNLHPFTDGQMDLYLFDDNYRIVIENKILSGINGKHEEVDGQITQLDTYRTYMDDLNDKGLETTKENKVVLLVPNQFANNFSNYTIEYGNPRTDHIVPVIKYKDLADFFTNHVDLIVERYRHDFLNILYKQSFTREEEINNRFMDALE